MDELFGARRSMIDLGEVRWGVRHKERMRIVGRYRAHPVGGAAREFPSWGSYARTVYARAYLLLATVESLVGRERMIRILGDYARRWSFDHPRSRDLVDALVTGAPAASRSAVRRLLQDVLVRGSSGGWSVSCKPGKVTVTRGGDLRLPLQVTLRLSDGTSRLVRYSGGQRSQTFIAPGLDGASLGPPGRLGLDPDPQDDACRVRGQHQQAASRLAAAVQLLLQVLGP